MLRRAGEPAAQPRGIISARGAERDKVRGLELGAEDYVTKPFGVRELQARTVFRFLRLIEQCGFDFCRAIAQQLYGFLI